MSTREWEIWRKLQSFLVTARVIVPSNWYENNHKTNVNEHLFNEVFPCISVSEYVCKRFAPGRIIRNGNYIIWTAYPLTGIWRSFHNCIVNDNVGLMLQPKSNDMECETLSLRRHTFQPTLPIYSNSWSRAKDRRLRYEILYDFTLKLRKL